MNTKIEFVSNREERLFGVRVLGVERHEWSRYEMDKDGKTFLSMRIEECMERKSKRRQLIKFGIRNSMFNKRLKNRSNGDDTSTDGTKSGIELEESGSWMSSINLNRIELISEEDSRCDSGVNRRSIQKSSIFSDTILIGDGRIGIGMSTNQFKEIGDMVEVRIHILGVRIKCIVCRRTEW